MFQFFLDSSGQGRCTVDEKSWPTSDISDRVRAEATTHSQPASQPPFGPDGDMPHISKEGRGPGRIAIERHCEACTRPRRARPERCSEPGLSFQDNGSRNSGSNRCFSVTPSRMGPSDAIAPKSMSPLVSTGTSRPSALSRASPLWLTGTGGPDPDQLAVDAIVNALPIDCPVVAPYWLSAGTFRTACGPSASRPDHADGHVTDIDPIVAEAESGKRQREARVRIAYRRTRSRVHGRIGRLTALEHGAEPLAAGRDSGRVPPRHGGVVGNGDKGTPHPLRAVPYGFKSLRADRFPRQRAGRARQAQRGAGVPLLGTTPAFSCVVCTAIPLSRTSTSCIVLGD